MPTEIKDYKFQARYFELRINCNSEEFNNIINRIKAIESKSILYKGISEIELGEKEEYKCIEHVHILLLYNTTITTQSIINKLKIIGSKNYDNEQLGYYIGHITKDEILSRLTYIYKIKTKVSKNRIMYEWKDEGFYEFLNESRILKKLLGDKDKDPMKLQKERIKIAMNMSHSDILITEDSEVLKHKGYFATTAGKDFFGSVRNKRIEELIEQEGYKYNCLPNADIKNKGLILPNQNIIIVGTAGSGKTRTMLYYIEKVLKKKQFTINPRPYMDRYDPFKYDYRFWDDIDATDIKEYGGMAKFKKCTDGKPFDYEEKHIKSLKSDYKPLWCTSNTEYLEDFKDKNDKNDSPHLSEALERRFHVLSIMEFCINFGIYWDNDIQNYKLEEPIPLIHKNGRYIKYNKDNKGNNTLLKEYFKILRNNI